MLEEIKNKNPLIHCITNPISITQCANTSLAIGARPVMAEHPREVREITKTADSLLLNLGNITDARIKSIVISAKTAKRTGIPITLDLVGIGCSRLRFKLAQRLIKKYCPTVIKGNYSEIYALYNPAYKVSGVDAEGELDEKIISEVSSSLAKKYNVTVLASGKVDIVSDSEKQAHIKNGTEKLSTVTGTGCMLGTLCATFLSVYDAFQSAVMACTVLGICGEVAETENGNASFLTNLFDALSTISDAEIKRKEEIHYEKI